MARGAEVTMKNPLVLAQTLRQLPAGAIFPRSSQKKDPFFCLAADVIEQLVRENEELVEERDELLSAIKGECNYCVHMNAEVSFFGHCQHDNAVWEDRFPFLPRVKQKCTNWQWRGKLNQPVSTSQTLP